MGAKDERGYRFCCKDAHALAAYPSYCRFSIELRETTDQDLRSSVPDYATHLFQGDSPLAAFVLSLSSVSPAAISSLTSYCVAQLFGVQFTESFTTLIVLVTVLSILTLQSSRYPTAELLVTRSSVALALLLRWIAMILLLGLISYASGLLHLYRDPLSVPSPGFVLGSHHACASCWNDAVVARTCEQYVV